MCQFVTSLKRHLGHSHLIHLKKMSSDDLRAVWYQLVDINGNPYTGTDVDKVILPPTADIVDVRNAVHVRNAPILSTIAPTQLKVFNTFHGLKTNTSLLKASTPLGYMGNAANNPLLVVVPSSTAPVSQDFSSETTKKRIDRLKQLIFFTWWKIEGHEVRGCATAYKRNRIATFAHGPHKNLKIGDVIPVYSLIGNVEHMVTVIQVDSHRDFITLESDRDLCPFEFEIAAPYEGEEYIQLGLSAMGQDVTNPLSIARGIVTSTKYNRRGHFLGSAGSNPGDSGGGCFDERSDIIYGINVGCDEVAISGETTLCQLGTRYPARSRILPCVFFN